MRGQDESSSDIASDSRLWFESTRIVGRLKLFRVELFGVEGRKSHPGMLRRAKLGASAPYKHA